LEGRDVGKLQSPHNDIIYLLKILHEKINVVSIDTERIIDNIQFPFIVKTFLIDKVPKAYSRHCTF
jgi:hypothetical protein